MGLIGEVVWKLGKFVRKRVYTPTINSVLIQPDSNRGKLGTNLIKLAEEDLDKEDFSDEILDVQLCVVENVHQGQQDRKLYDLMPVFDTDDPAKMFTEKPIRQKKINSGFVVNFGHSKVDQIIMDAFARCHPESSDKWRRLKYQFESVEYFQCKLREFPMLDALEYLSSNELVRK